MRHRYDSLAAVSLFALAAAPAVHAQAPATTPSTGSLPAVTVNDSVGVGTYTAPAASLGALGDLPIIDTPFSINVLTRDLIENQQAQAYGDYLKNDPSTNISNVPVGFASVRGFSLGTAGYVYDGVPGSQPLSDGRYQLIGFDRIEVFKGASSFLYGLGTSSSLGGTLNFVPKKPEDGPIRTITTGVVSRSVGSVAADLGDRFGENKQFGYRLNVGVKDGEQATRNADWKQRAAALALDWRVNPDLTLSAGADYARNRYPQLQPFFILSPGVDVPRAPDARRNIAQPWDDFVAEGSNAWLRADWRLAPDWTLTAQGLHSVNRRPSRKEARFGLITDVDGSALLFGSQDGGYSSTGDTAQLTVRGKVATGPLLHTITLAATETQTENRSGTTGNLGFFPTNLYTPTDYPEPAATFTGPKLRTQQTSTSSLLATDIIKFSERWSALVGARYGRLTVDNYEPLSGTLLNSNPLRKTTPVGALMFKPTPESLLYLNYAQGIEPGGTAPVGSLNANQVLPPIVTKQVEVGGKLQAGGVLWTAALFDMRKPFEYLDPNSFRYVQNGEQRHRGAEITASGQLTRDLSLVAGAMVLDPKVSNTGDPATEGKRPVGVSRFIANVFADYRIGAVPGLFVNGGVYHASSQFLDGANQQRVAAWTRLDAGLRYETRLGATPTTFYFNVENLTDKRYWSSALSGILTLAEPRTYKVSARFSF